MMATPKLVNIPNKSDIYNPIDGFRMLHENVMLFRQLISHWEYKTKCISIGDSRWQDREKEEKKESKHFSHQHKWPEKAQRPNTKYKIHAIISKDSNVGT